MFFSWEIPLSLSSGQQRAKVTQSRSPLLQQKKEEENNVKGLTVLIRFPISQWGGPNESTGFGCEGNLYAHTHTHTQMRVTDPSTLLARKQ